MLETIIVCLIIAAALAWFGWRAWRMFKGNSGCAACAGNASTGPVHANSTGGCGHCPIQTACEQRNSGDSACKMPSRRLS